MTAPMPKNSAHSSIEASATNIFLKKVKIIFSTTAFGYVVIYFCNMKMRKQNRNPERRGP